jgi:hypothetical protein
MEGLAISGGSIQEHESEDDRNKMIFPHEMNFSQGTFSSQTSTTKICQTSTTKNWQDVFGDMSD